MAERKLKSITISKGGKDNEYVQVHTRIIEFRRMYPTGSILTDIISHENGVIVMRTQAVVDGQILAVGHAYEKEGATFINKSSYIENCETSSIGRCLGVLGIGIENGIASELEVQNAKAQANDVPKKIHTDAVVHRHATILKNIPDKREKQEYWEGLDAGLRDQLRELSDENAS